MEVGVVSELHIIFLDSKQAPGVIKDEFEDVLHILSLKFHVEWNVIRLF